MDKRDKKEMNRREFLKIVGVSTVASTVAMYGCASGEKSNASEASILGEVPVDKMTYRTSPKGEHVSLLGYGCMRWPLNVDKVLAECEARAGLESESRRILEEFRGYRLLSGFEIIPQSVQTKNDLIRFCVEEQTREFVGTGYRYYNVRRLWNDPLFQDWMPITHTVGSQVYTLEETQLKTAYPETVLIWNEEWRK